MCQFSTLHVAFLRWRESDTLSLAKIQEVRGALPSRHQAVARARSCDRQCLVQLLEMENPVMDEKGYVYEKDVVVAWLRDKLPSAAAASTISKQCPVFGAPPCLTGTLLLVRRVSKAAQDPTLASCTTTRHVRYLSKHSAHLSRCQASFGTTDSKYGAQQSTCPGVQAQPTTSQKRGWCLQRRCCAHKERMRVAWAPRRRRNCTTA